MLNIELWSVHEDIFFYRMSMQIDKKVQSLLIFCLEILDQLKEMKCLRKGEFPWLIESSVQIFSKKACPIIASNNSVWIYHWNNKCNKILSKLFGFSLITANIFEKSFANEWAVGLTWMNSSCQYQNFFIMVLRFFVSNFQNWYWQSA